MDRPLPHMPFDRYTDMPVSGANFLENLGLLDFRPRDIFPDNQNHRQFYLDRRLDILTPARPFLKASETISIVIILSPPPLPLPQQVQYSGHHTAYHQVFNSVILRLMSSFK
jgi:hypothetical protein